jgi:glycosyltransferase involved in cell wall biosynthesis
MDDKLRVVHVLEELRLSGAERMLLIAAPRFAQQGIETHILSSGTQEGVAANQFRELGVVVHHLPFTKRLSFFSALASLFRRESFDAVHVHMEQASWWVILTALLGARIPVVRTVHNSFPFTGSLRIRRALQRRSLQRLGVIHVAPGASVAENERRRFGNDCRVISNWFDPDAFPNIHSEDRARARAHFGICSGEIAIASIGNCGEAKGHSVLLGALHLLARRGVNLLYLHAGAEDAKQSERALARDLGLDGVARFLGPLEEVPQLLAASDVFVMPSSYEGSSVAALEALASGVQVVFTDVPGLKDHRSLFPEIEWAAADEESLAFAIGQAVDKAPGHRDHTGVKQRARARTLFGPERGVSAYSALYRQLAN